MIDLMITALSIVEYFHSRDVKSSNSRSRRILSDGSSRISMPGPTDLELRPLGKI